VQSKQTDKPRKFKTDIIESLMIKQPDGSYAMNLKNMMFDQTKTKYEDSATIRSSEGLQKSTFVASVFHGNVALFEEAVKQGEVVVTHDRGIQYYASRKFTQSASTGSTQRATIKGDRRMPCVAMPVLCTCACLT
jgi:hypothetical protein